MTNWTAVATNILARDLLCDAHYKDVLPDPEPVSELNAFRAGRGFSSPALLFGPILRLPSLGPHLTVIAVVGRARRGLRALPDKQLFLVIAII